MKIDANGPRRHSPETAQPSDATALVRREWEAMAPKTESLREWLSLALQDIAHAHRESALSGQRPPQPKRRSATW